MKVSTLMTAVTVNENGSEVQPQTLHHREGAAQVEITGGTVNVVIEGKLIPDAPWEEVFTFTATDCKVIALFPYMRATTNSISGATVSAWLQHD